MIQCVQILVLLGSSSILILLILASAVIQDVFNVLLPQLIVLYLHVLKDISIILSIAVAYRTVQTTSTTTI